MPTAILTSLPGSSTRTAPSGRRRGRLSKLCRTSFVWAVVALVTAIVIVVVIPKQSATTAAGEKSEVRAALVRADTLRLMIGSPWLASPSHWSIATGTSRASWNTGVGTKPIHPSSNLLGAMGREQGSLISQWMGSSVASSTRSQLASAIGVDTSREIFPWVAQVYGVSTQTIDISGNQAGIRAKVFAWQGGTVPTRSGPKLLKLRMELDEYATFKMVGGHWREVSDRSYEHPVSGNPGNL